jgi:hypothetical protein
MKTNIHFLFAIFPSLLILMSSCNLLTDDDTDKRCKENEASSPVTIPVQVLITFYRYNQLPAQDHNIVDALEVEFHGNIRLIDCYGSESDFKEINHTIYPSEYTNPQMESYIDNVGPVFYFDFNNAFNYLTVTYTMMAVFADGNIYESAEVSEASLKFSDMELEGGSFYMRLEYLSTWHEVVK